jgi:hypothetical protein
MPTFYNHAHVLPYSFLLVLVLVLDWSLSFSFLAGKNGIR